MVRAVLPLVITVVALAATLYKLPDLIRRRDNASWSLYLGLALLALALALGSNESYAFFIRIGGSFGRDLDWALQKVSISASGLMMQFFFVYSIYTRGQRSRPLLWRGITTASTLVAFTGAFSAAVLSGEFNRGVPESDYHAVPWTTISTLIYTTHLAWCMEELARLALTNSRLINRTVRPWLRIGLRFLAAGSTVCLIWCVHKAGFVGLVMTGWTPPWRQFEVELLILLVGIPLMVIGLTIPAWGPPITRLRHWIQYHRAYQRLAPLWEALIAEFPGVQLQPPYQWRTDRLNTTVMHGLLRRRVIEIWDGHRLAAPFLDPGIRDQLLDAAAALGLTGQDRAVVVEATALQIGLDRHHRKYRPRPEWALNAPPLQITSSTGDMSVEVAWLSRVAAALDAPHTRHLLAEVSPTHQPATHQSAQEFDTVNESARGTVTHRLAKLLTEVLAPWVSLVLLSLVTGWFAGQGNWINALLWGLTTTIFAAGLPMAFIVRGAKQGRWDGHHVRNRAGRLIPLAVCLASVIVGYVLLLLLGAPAVMLALSWVYLAVLVLCISITSVLKWKISLHAAVSAGMATAIPLYYGPAWWLLWIAVAAVSWSRVELGDHTRAQVAAGAAVGAVCTLAIMLPVL